MNHLSFPVPSLQGFLGQICQQHLQAFVLQISSSLFGNSINEGIKIEYC